MPCKTDNGRALARIAKLAGERFAFLQFTDGKVYRVEPVIDADLIALTPADSQPGCWFNKVLTKRVSFKSQRWPNFPEFGVGAISLDWRKHPVQSTRPPGQDAL